MCFSEKGSAVCLQGEQDSKESNCRAHSEHLNLHASLDRSKSGTRAKDNSIYSLYSPLMAEMIADVWPLEAWTLYAGVS